MRHPFLFPLLVTLLSLSALFFLMLLVRFFPEALPSPDEMIGMGGRWRRL